MSMVPGMSECSEVEPLLAAYVDGEVAPGDQRAASGAPGRVPGLPAPGRGRSGRRENCSTRGGIELVSQAPPHLHKRCAACACGPASRRTFAPTRWIASRPVAAAFVRRDAPARGRRGVLHRAERQRRGAGDAARARSREVLPVRAGTRRRRSASSPSSLLEDDVRLADQRADERARRAARAPRRAALHVDAGRVGAHHVPVATGSRCRSTSSTASPESDVRALERAGAEAVSGPTQAVHTWSSDARPDAMRVAIRRAAAG